MGRIKEVIKACPLWNEANAAYVVVMEFLARLEGRKQMQPMWW